MSDWTQPVCLDDWERRNPGREPNRLAAGFIGDETCCDCGVPTRSRIYIRVDPATVTHPTTSSA